MRDDHVYDNITAAQNTGTPCNHCGAKYGHYGRCITLNSRAKTSVALTDILVLNSEDRKLLAGLRISTEGDNR